MVVVVTEAEFGAEVEEPPWARGDRDQGPRRQQAQGRHPQGLSDGSAPAPDPEPMENSNGTREDAARALIEKVRETYGDGATIDRLILVASVTEEDGSQRIAIEAADGLALYEQQGTLRRAFSTITR